MVEIREGDQEEKGEGVQEKKKEMFSCVKSVPSVYEYFIYLFSYNVVSIFSKMILVIIQHLKIYIDPIYNRVLNDFSFK